MSCLQCRKLVSNLCPAWDQEIPSEWINLIKCDSFIPFSPDVFKIIQKIDILIARIEKMETKINALHK